MSIEARVWPCAACGAPLPTLARACPRCGAAVAQSAQAPSAQLESMRQGAERRLQAAGWASGNLDWLAPLTVVACGGCGGPVAYRPSDAGARCPHCGATTFATTPIDARLVDAAAYVADRASEAAAAQQRANQAAAYVGRKANASLLVVCAVIGCLLVAGATALVLALAGGTIVGALVASSLGVAAAIAAPRALRRRPSAAVDAAVAALGASTHGLVERDGVALARRFLDAAWLDVAPAACITPLGSALREHRWSVVSRHQGCPTLVVVVDAADLVHAWTGFLFAAEIPLHADPAAVRAEARLPGAEVLVSRAGICFSWDAIDLAALEPASVTRAFAEAARLVELGRRMARDAVRSL